MLPPPSRIPSPSKRNDIFKGASSNEQTLASTTQDIPQPQRPPLSTADGCSSSQNVSESGDKDNGSQSRGGTSRAGQGAPRSERPPQRTPNGSIQSTKKDLNGSTRVTKESKSSPGVKLSNPTTLARSKSIRHQPTRPTSASASKVTSTARSTSSTSKITASPAKPTSPPGSLNVRAAKRLQGTMEAPKSHLRTQSVNQPPTRHNSTTSPGTRKTSAATGLNRALSTSSKSGDRVTSSGSSPKLSTTSTSRSVTPRTSRESRQVSGSAAQLTKQTRPSFSTLQKSFTPIRQAKPSSTFSTPAKRSTATTTTASSTKATAGPPIPSTTAPIRAQTHLLHLSLLHAAAPRTLQSYLASATTALESRFTALYALYTHTLLLERDARQAGNLRALHAWSGGSTAALSRKLNVLTGVLAELMALTAPGRASARDNDEEDNDDNGERDGETPLEQDAGSYVQCVARFEKWAAWVRGVWALRDADEEAASGFEEDGVTKQTNTLHNDTDSDDDGRVSAPPHPQPQPQPREINDRTADAYTPIEGLGDGTKASLRALTTQLNALDLRLRDLAVPPIPDNVGGGGGLSEAGHSPTKTTTTSTAKAPSTPAHVMRCARDLVAGMLEEVQVMREVEFEVVVGERAWVEERVRRIGEEIGDARF